MRIRSKLTISILCSALIALIGISIIYFYVNFQSTTKEFLYDMEVDTAEHSKEISHYLREKINIAKTVTSAPVLLQSLLKSNYEFSLLTKDKRTKKITALNEKWIAEKDIKDPFIQSYMSNSSALYMRDIQGSIPAEYGEIFLTNRYGSLVSTTGKLTTLAHAHKYWWKSAYNGGKGKAVIDDRGYDESVGDHVIGIVVPIIEDGEVIGILKSNLLLKNTLSQLSYDLNHRDHNLETRHSTSIIRSNGKIVSKSDELQIDNRLINKIVDRIKINGSETTTIKLNGKHVLLTYLPVNVDFTFKNKSHGNVGPVDHRGGNTGEDWYVLEFLYFDKIIASIIGEAKSIILLDIILIIIVVLTGFVMSNIITAPIRKLTSFTKELGKGNFDVPIEVSSKDEFGELSHTFNGMAQKLSKKTEQLENEIISRKNAYELLEINEDRYRSMLNNAPNVVVCMTGEHFITEFNKEAERIFGYNRSDVVGKDYIKLFIPKEYHESVVSDIQKVLSGDPTFGYENPVISKDGLKYDFLWNVTPMLNIEGVPVGIIAMGVDITDRKKAENALINLAEQFSAVSGSEFFDKVVWHLSVTLDMDYVFIGELIEGNSKVRVLAGCSKGDKMEPMVYDLAGTPCDNVAGKSMCCYPSAVQQEFPKDTLLVDMEVEAYIGIPLFDRSGKPLGIMVMMDRKPIQNKSVLESTMNIFSGRISVEMERTKVERSLHDEMNFRKIILDNIPCAAMLLKPDTHEVIACNEKGIALGLKTGKNCYDIWAHTNPPCPWCLCQESVITDKPLQAEVKYNNNVYELHWIPVKKDLTLHYIFDITEHKKTEDALERSKNNLAEAQRMAHLGSWDLDLSTNTLKWSDEIFRIFGLQPEKFESTYETFLNNIHPDDREMVEKSYRDSINKNIPYSLSHRIVRPDGTERIVYEKCEHIRDKSGKVIRSIGMVQDITERRILEKAIIDFEEHERQRIGHDLHDDVGQLLTGLGFKTQGVLSKIKDINSDEYRDLKDIAGLVELVKNKLRHVSKGLLPVDSTDIGLIESIEGLVSDLTTLFDIKCSFEYMESFNLKNSEAVIHLYRIVQEAVTNALKHSKADKIKISLDRLHNDVTMIIKDNGIGISESLLSKGGIGLKIMEYRARLINASLQIFKDANSGTVVKCIMIDR